MALQKVSSITSLSFWQARAQDSLDIRADLYAVGCVSHWLLTVNLYRDKPPHSVQRLADLPTSAVTPSGNSAPDMDSIAAKTATVTCAIRR